MCGTFLKFQQLTGPKLFVIHVVKKYARVERQQTSNLTLAAQLSRIRDKQKKKKRKTKKKSNFQTLDSNPSHTGKRPAL